MAVEAEEFYNNLNELLSDIMKFLNDEVNYKKLSVESRLQADKLINRSKKQLQEIAKIQVNSDDQAYVDMDAKKSDISDDKSNDNNEEAIYYDVDGPRTSLSTTSPYEDLPASQLNRNQKFGKLTLKTKIKFGFEKKRKLFAGIHFDRFILYLTEKDLKPHQIFDLNCCEAEEIQKNNTKPSDEFLLMTKNDNKVYCFIALSYKDMLQWVTFINKKATKKVYNTFNTFADDILPCEVIEENEEETYTVVDEQQNRPPELPQRPSQLKPVPPTDKTAIKIKLANELSSSLKQNTNSCQIATDSDSDENYSEVVEKKDLSNIYKIINSKSESNEDENKKSDEIPSPPPTLPLTTNLNSPPAIPAKPTVPIKSKPSLLVKPDLPKVKILPRSASYKFKKPE